MYDEQNDVSEAKLAGPTDKLDESLKAPVYGRLVSMAK
jgi:hypothetical protein